MSTSAPKRIRAVIMDVDGTLAMPGEAPSVRTCSAVARLRAAGLVGIIATGRAERVAVRVAQMCGLTTPVVSAGGPLTTDPITMERLRLEYWSPEAASKIAGVAGALGCQPLLWTPDHTYAEMETRYTEFLEPFVGEPVRIARFEDVLAREKVIKVLVTSSPERLDEVGPTLERLAPGLKRAMPGSYDAAPPGSSKREAIDGVLRRFGLARSECLGIGDGDTDIEWMSGLGHAVAMQNASSGVRAIADEMIGSDRDDGVARYLEGSLLAGLLPEARGGEGAGG